MNALWVFLVMVKLADIRGEKDYAFRWELATALAEVTDDPEEEETLARIAWYESGFRRNVARCEIKGDSGKSLGTFQVQPMQKRDAALACSHDLKEQASLALAYVHRSAEQCPKNEGAAKLNLYVSGKCGSPTVPFKQATLRWGGQSEVAQ